MSTARPTRRRNIVTLTASGRRYLEEIQRHADVAQDELLAGLNPGERRQLNELLARLLRGQPVSAPGEGNKAGLRLILLSSS